MDFSCTAELALTFFFLVLYNVFAVIFAAVWRAGGLRRLRTGRSAAGRGSRAFRFDRGESGVYDFDPINDALVNLFRDLMDLEENAIITSEFSDLTNNEMHVIDAVGIDEPKNMTQIAAILSVTVGTLTTAMNSLVKKGYCVRERGADDRRIVEIRLTERGRAAYFHHRDFHKKMIRAIADDMTDEEMSALVSMLKKLNKFFRTFE